MDPKLGLRGPDLPANRRLAHAVLGRQSGHRLRWAFQPLGLSQDPPGPRGQLLQQGRDLEPGIAERIV